MSLISIYNFIFLPQFSWHDEGCECDGGAPGGCDIGVCDGAKVAAVL